MDVNNAGFKILFKNLFCLFFSFEWKEIDSTTSLLDHEFVTVNMNITFVLHSAPLTAMITSTHLLSPFRPVHNWPGQTCGLFWIILWKMFCIFSLVCRIFYAKVQGNHKFLLCTFTNLKDRSHSLHFQIVWYWQIDIQSKQIWRQVAAISGSSSAVLISCWCLWWILVVSNAPVWLLCRDASYIIYHVPLIAIMPFIVEMLMLASIVQE